MNFFYHFRDEYESVVHSNDNIAPVGYLNFKKIHVQDKTVRQRLLFCFLKNFLSNLIINHAKYLLRVLQKDQRYKRD